MDNTSISTVRPCFRRQQPIHLPSVTKLGLPIFIIYYSVLATWFFSSALLFKKTMELNRTIFTISFTTLLAEILQQYGLPEPLYKQYRTKNTGKYKVIMKITTEQDKSPIKIRSKPLNHLDAAMQDIAQRAIEKLKECHNFEVGDYNLQACLRERKKRRTADIKRVYAEMEFECLKDRIFDVWKENR